jgi:hypothetical protein
MSGLLNLLRAERARGEGGGIRQHIEYDGVPVWRREIGRWRQLMSYSSCRRAKLLRGPGDCLVSPCSYDPTTGIEIETHRAVVDRDDRGEAIPEIPIHDGASQCVRASGWEPRQRPARQYFLPQLSRHRRGVRASITAGADQGTQSESQREEDTNHK